MTDRIDGAQREDGTDHDQSQERARCPDVQDRPLPHCPSDSHRPDHTGEHSRTGDVHDHCRSTHERRNPERFEPTVRCTRCGVSNTVAPAVRTS